MMDVFAQDGRVEAKDRVDGLLAVPWFASRKGDLYRLISAYNQIIENMPEGRTKQSAEQQAKFNEYVEEFVRKLKALTDFDARDEARVSQLLADPEYMDGILIAILEDLE
jgi:hypothetical protein